MSSANTYRGSTTVQSPARMSPSFPSPHPLYIGDQAEPVFALFHPAAEPPRDIAVLLCAPFGWEDMCSYRSRRAWAQQLAAHGYPALRFDYPGSGDSGGSPFDPERLRAWTEALATAACRLRDRTGCRRVLAIGIGFGGFLALHAAAGEAAVDDFVLWGVSARGHTLLRELRAFSKLETHQLDGAISAGQGSTQAGDGSLEVAGYVLSAETLRDLDALDFSDLELPGSSARRVLLLERDGRDVDARLLASIERCGAQVTVAGGDGYADMMMAEPQDAVPAQTVFDRVASWLGESSRPIAQAPLVAFSEPATTELTLAGDKRARETPITFPHDFGRPFGVLTEPLNQTADLCAVWLNGGPQRHSGPNRMWVEAARRWAAQGVPSLRIDLAGIGDAEGDSRPLVDARSFFVPEYLQQVRLALDFLQARGTASRFVLIGLCAGGYWALQVALEDERVCAALMLNPGLLLYDGGWSKALADTQTVARKALRTSTWRRVLSGQSTLSAHLRTARILLAGTRRARLGLVSRRARRDRGDKSDHDEIDRAFDTLRERGQRALMVFAGEERLYGRLRREGRLDRMGRWPNIAVEHIAPTGDLHTLRPLWLQCRVHQMLDEALDRELASSFSGHPLGIASGRGAR